MFYINSCSKFKQCSPPVLPVFILCHTRHKWVKQLKHYLTCFFVFFFFFFFFFLLLLLLLLLLYFFLVVVVVVVLILSYLFILLWFCSQRIFAIRTYLSNIYAIHKRWSTCSTRHSLIIICTFSTHNFRLYNPYIEIFKSLSDSTNIQYGSHSHRSSRKHTYIILTLLNPTFI